ncbi:glycosyltransferase [Bacteroides ovatus]|nr:glycosyltransferase [Bacteroides ovatus]
MKKLAIIIPAYKPRFLQETLDSIAKQNSHEFTVYIGDDASPYPLKTIVDHYKNKFDIIYHRFEQNMGKKRPTRPLGTMYIIVRRRTYMAFFR